MILKEEEVLLKAKEVLEKGGIVVAPTDTIYGMLADATNEEAVKRLYEIRRPSGKPFLVLIPDESWIVELCLDLPEEYKPLLHKEGITLVLKKRCDKLSYISKDSLAVRIPKKGFVRKLLDVFKKPLVAPSVNPEGKKPATTIEEAYRYFGDKVELYVDGGKIEGEPSTLVDLREGLKVLREGRVKKEEIERIIDKL
ncbi:L-threonylcarbamoyladenylate synthase [Aquifex pyrophilus]